MDWDTSSGLKRFFCYRCNIPGADRFCVFVRSRPSSAGYAGQTPGPSPVHRISGALPVHVRMAFSPKRFCIATEGGAPGLPHVCCFRLTCPGPADSRSSTRHTAIFSFLLSGSKKGQYPFRILPTQTSYKTTAVHRCKTHPYVGIIQIRFRVVQVSAPLSNCSPLSNILFTEDILPQTVILVHAAEIFMAYEKISDGTASSPDVSSFRNTLISRQCCRSSIMMSSSGTGFRPWLSTPTWQAKGNPSVKSTV